MAVHDYILANQSGSSFRSDLNNALAAIVSQNSSSTEPATKYAYQYWVDTSATPALIKQRNAANDAWITLAEVDGQTLAADGTNAKPGIAFAADINTGLKRNAADDISIVTGGTQAITVDSSQNIGIGTSNPFGKLHLQDDTSNLEMFLIGPSTGSTRIRFGDSDDSNIGQIIYDNTSDSLQIHANNAERMRINSSGNAGIGTSNPATPLHIAKTAAASGFSETLLRLERSSFGGEIGGYIHQQVSHGITFSTVDSGTATEKMRLLSSGGITFNGDTAQANALDDYEEGTWTPSFVNGSYTYGTQSGQFTKIGNVITVHAMITWTAKSGSGILRANLPAAAAGTRVAGSVGYVEGVDVSSSFRQIVIATSAGETFNTWFLVGQNTPPNNMSVQNLSSSGQVQFTMTYTVQ